MTRLLANPHQSAARYQNAWVLVASVQYIVSSNNYQSGSLVSGQTAVNAIASGADFELHQILPPDDKDRAIDETIKRLRVRQEVGFPSTDGLDFYALSGVASPHTVNQVLNAYYFADPTNTLNRDRRDFVSKVPVQTATGLELRVSPPVPSGYQIAIDAILTLSLGSGDAATVNIPDDQLVLWGAAARSYDLLMRQTPGQVSETYKGNRQDAAREFSRLSAINKAQVSRTVQFDTPVGPGPLWWTD